MLGRAGLEPATSGLKSGSTSCNELSETERCCKSDHLWLQRTEARSSLRGQACSAPYARRVGRVGNRSQVSPCERVRRLVRIMPRQWIRRILRRRSPAVPLRRRPRPLSARGVACSRLLLGNRHHEHRQDWLSLSRRAESGSPNRRPSAPTGPTLGVMAHRAEPLVRKTVTVLFCDVVGSTTLGESVDPETNRGVILRYFDLARSVLTSHGGTVEKFIGDAVMAVFCVPHVHEDDALRAVKAADE